MLHLPPISHLAIALAATGAIALLARKARALTTSGAIAAATVGFLLFGFAGWLGATALLLFFITSTALSRLGKRHKEALAFEKGGQRDAGQVLANGGIAALCAAGLAFFPSAAWLIAALLGALAEANADTWATEIGSLARGPARLITTLRMVPPGTSGGVSLPGTIAALCGALLVALTAAFCHMGLGVVLAAVCGGFLGSLFDSVLGATVQAQYRCPACDKLTEQRSHCDGQATVLARGLPWVNNDLVNLLSTLFAAVLTAGGILIMAG